MKDQEEKSAKKEEELVWRACPICLQVNPMPPQFKDFLPLIKHMTEHFWDWEEAPSVDPKDVLPGPQKPPKQKFPPRAKPLLAKIADWLEEALNAVPEISSIRTSNVKVANQLVDFARQLPDRFSEQREYLLRHEAKLRDTGMDPKWRSTPGRQSRFVAESMAGAEWNLQPSASREFIRQQKARRGAAPGVDQRWWEVGEMPSKKALQRTKSKNWN